MDAVTFKEYQEFIRAHSGICLANGKEALVSSRISKRIRELDLESEMDYLNYVKAEESIDELTRLIDLISTNVTHFMREPVHFECIAQYVRNAWSKGSRPLKFWSAACSTGQEPYSLAMTLADIATELCASTKNLKILATDISTRVLARATEGIYSSEEMETLPKMWIDRYFSKCSTPGRYTIKDTIKNLVSFKRLNLSKIPYPMQGPFDAIMCRNVMIYFDLEIRTRIVSEVSRLLQSQGLFLIGHSESLSGIEHDLTSPSPTVYRKG